MTLPRFRLRMWHLLGLIAAAAAYFAVFRYREGVYDPAMVEARRLRSYDPAARLEAADRLRTFGREAESAIPALLGALNDGDPRVRARAALAAVDIVRDPDHPRAGDLRAALAAALADPDPGARHAAAVALGGLGPDSKVALPALIEAAGDPDVEIRRRAVGELGGFDDEAAWLVVVEATRDRDINVRNQAIHAIGWRPSAARLAAVREALAPALKDANEVIRGGAASTLGRYTHKIPADVPELYDALVDPAPYVRQMACVFLPDGPGVRPAVPILLRSLDDPAPEVRAAAAHRLGQIGLDAEPTLSALRRAIEDKEEIVRKAASEAIQRIEAKANDFRTKLLPGALEDLASPDADVRRGAAEALGSFGPHSAPALPALEALARDPDQGVRRAAESATSAIKAGEQGP